MGERLRVPFGCVEFEGLGPSFGDLGSWGQTLQGKSGLKAY